MNSPAMGENFLRISMVVIDDDHQSLAWIESAFKRPDLEILTATDAAAGLELVRQRGPQIALVNPGIPYKPDVDLLQSILAVDPAIKVVLMTSAAYSNIRAMEAIDRGACDYIAKPLPMERLRQRIGWLIQEAEWREILQRRDRESSEICRLEGCVGRSPIMLDVFSRIASVAPHFRTALIGGPPGTGKKRAALALHRLSPAPEERFFAYDCEPLTISDCAEIFCSAHSGGTIFLEDIDRSSIPVQGKLVQLLKSSTGHKANVRIIATTSRDLETLTRERQFRLDLLQLLSAVEIHLPALKERREDLPLLIQYFLKEYAGRNDTGIPGLTQRAEKVLHAYDWPANVRELEEVIAHAAKAAKSNRIDVHDLPAAVQNPSRTNGIDLVTSEESQYLHARRMLNFLKGDKIRTAAALGVSRATLYRLLARSRSVDA